MSEKLPEYFDALFHFALKMTAKDYPIKKNILVTSDAPKKTERKEEK